MEIKIDQEDIKVVTQITVDGVEYPLHKWNIDKANRYLLTGDEKYINELKDFSLDLD